MNSTGSKLKLQYVTGTRADFGLMRRSLLALNAHADIDLSLWVTGMHLDANFGSTVKEVEATGLTIAHQLALDMQDRTGRGMAVGLGQLVQHMAQTWSQDRPDLVMLLGDRAEMLAAATAALYVGVPTLHLHGGERSGTVDEPVRHAVSKLSTYHACATEQSAERLRRMGEAAERVCVVGAPGLDGIVDDAGAGQADLDTQLIALGLQPAAAFVLCVFHPVVQQASMALEQTQTLLAVLREHALQTGEVCIWLEPNADAGSADILHALHEAQSQSWLRLVKHFARPTYCAALRAARALVGNSSSGVIEAASFGTPVLNVGDRQRLREASSNVQDVALDAVAIGTAMQHARAIPQSTVTNVYGDGRTAQRLITWIRSLKLGVAATEKVNAY